MKAYHIDRRNSLTIGRLVTLDKSIKMEPSILQTILDERYPDGFSHHGDNDFTRLSDRGSAGQFVHEAIYEYERKLYFPEMNSRYQSFFGLKTKEDVTKWLSLFTQKNLDLAKNYTIWEIDTLDSKVNELDSVHLGGGTLEALEKFSPVVVAYHATNYWSGIKSQNPRMELLISPSFLPLRKMSLSEIIE